MQACILVRSGVHAVLLDCGASSLIAMKRSGIDPGGVESVLLTHLHGDHFGGVPFLILDGQFSHRRKPLTIAGPKGTLDRVQAAMEVLFPGSSHTRQRFAIRFIEWSAGVGRRVGGFRVVPFEVEHASGARAFALRLIQGNKVISYSGDTQWAESLIPAASGSDLFICEAYSFAKRIKNHLDYQTLARHRSSLRCRRIVLTHLSPDMLEHLSDVDLPSAEDGDRFVIS